MKTANAYDDWQQVKLKINKRFDEVKRDYASDVNKYTGRRPSTNDAKYSIFGYSVKFFKFYHIPSHWMRIANTMFTL